MARPATAAVRLLTGEREPVRLATTGNVTLYGLQSIDGVLTTVGTRVLVKDQTDATENGIYTASAGQWYRASDARSSRTMQKGTTVHVQLGSANAGKVFTFQTDEPAIGTDDITIVFYQSDDTIGAVNTAISDGLTTIGAAGDAELADISAAGDTAIAAVQEAGADVTAIKAGDTDASGFGFVLDEDDMASDSATKIPTQQSVKAYVDATVPGDGDPIIILSTGQSNIANHPALDWVPPSNLFLWGWDGLTDTDADTGTAFAAMDATTMGVAYSLGAKIAKEHPANNVYVINIGIGAIPISKWMTGSPDPDMYAACKNNVEAALTILGKDQIDYMLWWQGENDADDGSTTYIADFETVLARFRAETWFPYMTPIVVMGMSVLSLTTVRDYNTVLTQLVARHPENLMYVFTAALPTAYWDTNKIHCNAAGYLAAGGMAYSALAMGPGSAVIRELSFDPVTGNGLWSNDANQTSNIIASNPNAGTSAGAALDAKSNAGFIRMLALSTLNSIGVALSGIYSSFAHGLTVFVQNASGAFAVRINNVPKMSLDGTKLDLPVGQIKFPSTRLSSTDANTLDGYSEGTNTPTIIGRTTAGVGTYTTQQCRYVEIGRLVFFQTLITWTGHTGTGTLAVKDALPVAPGSAAGTPGFGVFSVAAVSLAYTGQLSAGFSAGSTTFDLQGLATGALPTNVAMDTAATVIVSGWYFRDD